MNEPLPVQFLLYLRALATGNLGESIKTGQPVTEILVERMPTTVELTLYALLFADLVGMTLGIISAYRRNSAADVGTMFVANLGVSIPVFVLGLLLAYLFRDRLQGHVPVIAAVGPAGARIPAESRSPRPGAWPTLGGPPRTVLDFLSNMYTVNGLLTVQLPRCSSTRSAT